MFKNYPTYLHVVKVVDIPIRSSFRSLALHSLQVTFQQWEKFVRKTWSSPVRFEKQTEHLPQVCGFPSLLKWRWHVQATATSTISAGTYTCEFDKSFMD